MHKHQLCTQLIKQVQLLLETNETLSDDSDLVFELGLDSVQFMNLLVRMERECNLDLSTIALDFTQEFTVTHLAETILACIAKPEDVEQQDLLLQGSINLDQEPELDIEVHCLVSSLCECIRKNETIDHRPMYFGVWDAEVFIDGSGALSYHNEAVNHGFLIRWFEKLYQINVEPWFNKLVSRSQNIDRLLKILESREKKQQVLVMLDLYQLPERENKFSKNPFPHYVLLELDKDPSKLWMWDPDFRWEGSLDKSRVLNAIDQACVQGGYSFSAKNMSAPKSETINQYFSACLDLTQNQISAQIKQMVKQHIAHVAEHSLENKGAKNSLFVTEEGSSNGNNAAKAVNQAQLQLALRELPVLAIRKYAYEHGFAFFWRELGLGAEEFEGICEQVEVLVRGFDKVLYLAAKYAESGHAYFLDELLDVVEQQDQREFSLKRRLCAVHQQWCQVNKLTCEQKECA